ncbi:MAG TPA: PAS domain-containing protein [Chthoniobacteraceae bacterium]|nr:PAS domain-containing protein [Chthoniobacteraceae bacterium]
MISVTGAFRQLPNYGADGALTLALRLAHAENALHAFTSGQVDAIVHPDGKTYLLRPAQEELRQRETWLTALIEGIPDVITVVNRGGIILFQSAAVVKVLGYRVDELLGKSLFDFVHPDDRARVYSAFINVIEGMSGDATVLFRHRTGQGSFQTIEGSIGKLGEPLSTTVVLGLRPATHCTLDCPEPDWQPEAHDAEAPRANGARGTTT